MALEISIDKKTGLLAIAGLFLLALLMGAYAYNSVPANPSIFGHSVDEVDGITCAVGQALTRTASGWSCVPVIGSGSAFGGMYTWNDEAGSCQTRNFLYPDFGCGCPIGFTPYPLVGNGIFTSYYCAK